MDTSPSLPDHRRFTIHWMVIVALALILAAALLMLTPAAAHAPALGAIMLP